MKLTKSVESVGNVLRRCEIRVREPRGGGEVRDLRATRDRALSLTLEIGVRFSGGEEDGSGAATQASSASPHSLCAPAEVSEEAVRYSSSEETPPSSPARSLQSKMDESYNQIRL